MQIDWITQINKLGQFGVILAPYDFWLLSDADRKAYGCGPGKIGDWLVPDTIWGHDIKVCCEIHDFQYEKGGDLTDKIFADRLLHWNIDSVIDASKEMIDIPSFYRSTSYYIAVRGGGDSSFNWRE